MYCKKCGADILQGDAFCSECGSAVTLQTVNKNKDKLKKSHKITVLVASLVLLAGAYCGIFLFRIDISSLFSENKNVESELNGIYEKNSASSEYQNSEISNITEKTTDESQKKPYPTNAVTHTKPVEKQTTPIVTDAKPAKKQTTPTVTDAKPAKGQSTLLDNENAYLDECPIIASDRYTGNECDSFVYPIGAHEYSRGNVCIDNSSYEHGVEGWIARWNYKSDSSWAYSVFNLDGKYKSLSGECKLIKSQNITDFNTTLEFWNGDTLIQKYQLTPDTIPFDINLDVTGCNNLKISFYDNEAKAGGTSFGLVDMKLSTSSNVSLNTNESSDAHSIPNISDITASSNLESQTYGEKTYNYSAKKAIDNDITTCWSEGTDEYGIGESITISFDKTYEISELCLWNGLCTSEDLF
jgi:hypothetical protein